LPSALDRACFTRHLELASQGRVQEAQEQFREGLRLQPDNFWCTHNLGAGHVQLGQWPLAIETLQRALLIDEDATGTRWLLGVACMRVHQWGQARQHLEQVLKHWPHSVEAHQSFGGVCQHAGELPEAIEHYRQALKLQLQQPMAPSPNPPARRGHFNSPAIEALLWFTLAQLAKADVHAFPTAGTLLGLIREGHLLPFDKDLDVALPFAELQRAQACLQDCGWQPLPKPDWLINPLSFEHKSGVVLDLCGFVLEQRNQNMLGGFWMRDAPEGWSRVTECGPVELKPVQTPYGAAWMHAQPENILVPLYGDWRTPDPDFDTVIAAKNLRGFSLLTECYALSRILDRWRSGLHAKAFASVRATLHHKPSDPLLLHVADHLQARMR